MNDETSTLVEEYKNIISKLYRTAIKRNEKKTIGFYTEE